MSHIEKKDLFAPATTKIGIKISKRRLQTHKAPNDLFGSTIKVQEKRPRLTSTRGKRYLSDIPSDSTWKDKHGSWAVKMGIIKD
jgi:hypothetical protein